MLIEGYRGAGASLEDIYGKWAVATGRAVPILGPGKYIASTPEDAAMYGRVVKTSISIDNPLLVGNHDTWADLCAAADVPHLVSTSPETLHDPWGVPAAIRRLRGFVESLGHDGAIVWNVRQCSLMRATFEHDQAVSFQKNGEET